MQVRGLPALPVPYLQRSGNLTPPEPVNSYHVKASNGERFYPILEVTPIAHERLTASNPLQPQSF